MRGGTPRPLSPALCTCILAGVGLLTTTTMTGLALRGGTTHRRSLRAATSRVAAGPVVPPGMPLADDAASADMSSSIFGVLLYISSIWQWRGRVRRGHYWTEAGGGASRKPGEERTHLDGERKRVVEKNRLRQLERRGDAAQHNRSQPVRVGDTVGDDLGEEKVGACYRCECGSTLQGRWPARRRTPHAPNPRTRHNHHHHYWR